jgi:glycosyltransferase involved in cell wall biosynthesis
MNLTTTDIASSSHPEPLQNSTPLERNLQSLRIWLVHDWLTGMRGGERVLLQLVRLFPQVKIATLFYVPGRTNCDIESRIAAVSFLQNFPRIDRHYRRLLPLMFSAIHSVELTPCDLVISTSHCVAKNIGVPQGARHLCHCFTPMRYIWDMREDYLAAQPNEGLKMAMELASPLLRQLDLAGNHGVDRFVGTCRNVCRRIERCYHRPATPVYSPIDDDFYEPSSQPPGDFYLVVSALVPYKRVDLAVRAFAADRKRRRLIVIGTGPELPALQRLARTSSDGRIQFLQWQDDASVRWHYQHCQALIFPGEEDFGLTPLEVQACGRPVIAYDRGGILETAIPLSADGSNRDQAGAIFFSTPTAESLTNTIDRYEAMQWQVNSMALRANAQRFNIAQFRREICRVSGELLRNEA